jgi:futalosine hydrolase
LRLWIHAAPLEGESVAWGPRAHACIGVGKTAAALGLARALAGGDVTSVVAVGVAGAHRAIAGGLAPLAVGDRCLVGTEVLGDEGVRHPDGFTDLAALGLGAIGPWAADEALLALAGAVLRAPVVAAATVSTCAGTDALAADVSARTGAAIETMEGAAIASVCAAFGVPWIQVRVVSNMTGDRDRAGWDLARALDELGRAIGELFAAGW